MNPSKGPDGQGLTGAYARQERLLEAFEAAWQRGERPAITDYLPQGTPDPALLLDFLQADLEHHLRASDPIRVEAYLERFPDLAHHRDQVIALIAWDYQLRQHQEPKPTVAEYLNRFPAYRDELRDRLQNDASRSSEPETTPPRPAAIAGSVETPGGAARGDQPLAGGEDRQVFWIGKYRVIERLGSGGQGDVYRAVHPTLGRDVVIKLARDSLPQASRQQLIDEGRVLARLDDPGLVRVYDVDLHEGRPFVVFVYVAGRSLADRLKQERPSFREAAALVAELARTLARLHRQGVLHRDLKPANVLIDEAGRPRLLDFGLASLTQHWSAINLPAPGISGTLAYMAPEQANGQSDRIGPRTDLFNLGALLYELLTGRPPYTGTDTLELWEQASSARMTPPRQLCPRLPRTLERICLTALAADPEQRYASAEALERALRGYLRRPRLIAGALGLGLVVAAGVLAFALGLPGWWKPAAFPPPNVPATVECVAIQAFDLRAFRGADGTPLGDVGVTTPDLREKDFVRAHAKFSAPAYCYLIAFNPNGKQEPCYPENEMEPPVRIEELFYPEKAEEGFHLTDGVGMQAFVLLASREPLPPYPHWQKQVGTAPWKKSQIGAWWRFNGKEYEGGKRGKGTMPVPKTLEELCDFFQKDRPGIDVFQVIAFPVKP